VKAVKVYLKMAVFFIEKAFEASSLILYWAFVSCYTLYQKKVYSLNHSKRVTRWHSLFGAASITAIGSIGNAYERHL
jgi:hypothetical protein